MPPRFPGISSIWLHAVSFRFADLATPARCQPPARAEGRDSTCVPEATFPTMDEPGGVQGASRVQMEDGIDFLSQMIAYCSFGANTGDDRRPDRCTRLQTVTTLWCGTSSFHSVGVEVSSHRVAGFVSDELAPAYAACLLMSSGCGATCSREVTLDRGRGDVQTAGRQYQAALEVVVADDASLTRLVSSPSWIRDGGRRRSPARRMHAARVERCITTKPTRATSPWRE